MRSGMRGFVAKIWPIILFLGIWEAATHVFGIPAYILPAPDRVITRIVESGGVLSGHTWISVIEIMAGFIAAALGGFLLGVAIVYSRRVEQAVELFLVVSQVIPKVALAPLFIIWFGHGLQPKIIIAATIAFFPVLVNTVLGLKSVDREIIEMMDSIAASQRQIFWRGRLPNSLPSILPWLPGGALLHLVGAVGGEFFGGRQGGGY